MAQRILVLAPYPLTSDYRARLRDVLDDEPRVLTAGDLRRYSAVELIRQVRDDRADHVLIVIPDEAAAPLVPALSGFALLTSSGLIEIIDRDLRRTKLSRSQIAHRLASAASASASGAASLANARRVVGKLMKAERQRATLVRDRGVLYLNAQLWLGLAAGGSVAHVAGVANALEEAGLRVSYASLSDPPGLRSGIDLIRLRGLSSLGLPAELNHVRLQHGVVRDLLAAVRSNPPGFLYQRLSLASFGGPLVARALQVPYVLEYNGSEIWAARNWGRPLRYEAFATASEDATLRHAHLIVTVSDVLRDELLSRGVEAERIVAHPNGVDPTAFDPDSAKHHASTIRRELGISQNAFVVGFIGTFGEWHGAELLARAARRLADANPAWFGERHVRFMLVGDGRRMPEVQEILGGLVGNIALLPGLVPQDAAAAYLAAADVLVSPHIANEDGSRFFGSPTKLFEYMAMAKPIIASDLEQLHDVLSPALESANLPADDPTESRPELAVLTPPGDLNELMRAIEFVSGSPAWCETLARNARARVVAQYTWRHHVQAILAGLDRVAGG